MSALIEGGILEVGTEGGGPHLEALPKTEADRDVAVEVVGYRTGRGGGLVVFEGVELGLELGLGQPEGQVT